MIELRRLFQREPQAQPSTAFAERPHSVQELQQAYEGVVLGLFARAGIARDCVQLELRHLGEARDGLDVFLAMVRLVAWDRSSAPRLMLGLPLLERSLRRAVRNHWLGEVSHFGGLWLHASTPVQEDTAMRELRAMVAALDTPDGEDARLAETAWGAPSA